MNATLCKVVFSVVSVVSLAACQRPLSGSTPSTAMARHEPGVSRVAVKTDAVAPLSIKVTGPDAPQPGTDIDVVIAIQRVSLDVGPVNLSLTLPKGLHAVDGALPEQLQASDGLHVVRELRFHVEQIPQEDLVVQADVQSDHAGIHASTAYRFGRPEPRMAPLPRRTAPTQFQGMSLGGLIPLAAK